MTIFCNFFYFSFNFKDKQSLYAIGRMFIYYIPNRMEDKMILKINLSWKRMNFEWIVGYEGGKIRLELSRP